MFPHGTRPAASKLQGRPEHLSAASRHPPRLRTHAPRNLHMGEISGGMNAHSVSDLASRVISGDMSFWRGRQPRQLRATRIRSATLADGERQRAGDGYRKRRESALPPTPPHPSQPGNALDHARRPGRFHAVTRVLAAIRGGLPEERNPHFTQFPFVFACLRDLRRELARLRPPD